jgi:serine protease Do
VIVNEVTPETPAARAALRRGDLIVTIGGKPVNGPGGLQSAVEVAPVGEPLTLGIDRDGERREIEVRPQEQPELFGLPREDLGPGADRRSRTRPRGPIIADPPEVPHPDLSPLPAPKPETESTPRPGAPVPRLERPSN